MYHMDCTAREGFMQKYYQDTLASNLNSVQGKGEHLKFKSVPDKLGGVQRARSVRRFAAQINLTCNLDRSSLVQLYLGSFMWMVYFYFYFYFSQEPRK